MLPKPGIRRTLERRVVERYRDPDGYLRVTVFLGNPHVQAYVRDISAFGLGMVVNHRVEPGATVSVELYHPVQKCWYLKLLRVLHVTPLDDDTWLVGGTFTRRLTDREIEELLADCGLLGPTGMNHGGRL